MLRPRPALAVLVLTVLAVPALTPPATQAQTNLERGGQTVELQQRSFLFAEDTQLRRLDPVFQQLFLPIGEEDLKMTTLVQLFPVDPRLLGQDPVRKAKVTVKVDGFSPSGVGVRLGSKKASFDRTGNAAMTRKIPGNSDLAFFQLELDFQGRFEVPTGTSTVVSSALETVRRDADPDCYDPTTLCLNDDRFKVEVQWRDFAGSSGPGVAFPRSDDSGSFFFFTPENWEMLVKVIDGCAFNDRFWVFAAATTHVEYEITVTDTLVGQSRVYANELGNAAAAVTDTLAFATCP